MSDTNEDADGYIIMLKKTLNDYSYTPNDELFSPLLGYSADSLRYVVERMYRYCAICDVVYECILYLVKNGMNNTDLCEILKILYDYNICIPANVLILLRSKGLITTEEAEHVLTYSTYENKDRCPMRDTERYILGLESAEDLVQRHINSIQKTYITTLCISVAMVSEKKGCELLECVIRKRTFEQVYMYLFRNSSTKYYPYWTKALQAHMLLLKPLREYDRSAIVAEYLAYFDYLLHCQDSQV